MERSKLEKYVDILKIVAQSGPLKISNVACKTNIGSSTLKKYLGFLLAQGLVNEQKMSQHIIVYSITQRGINVLEFFTSMNQEVPLTNQNISFDRASK